MPDEVWLPLRDKCWVQNEWSASITPKGAFFCEIAAALDMLFDGPGGWKIEPGWWRRTPEEFGDVPPEMIPITEETRIKPINPYAASKVAQDMVCITYHASYNFDIVRTRAFNHEGARRYIHGAIASFAYQIARIENNLQEPVIKVGNLNATRNFTDVRDTVKAYYLAMEKGVSGELYLIGSEQIHTMKEVLIMHQQQVIF